MRKYILIWLLTISTLSVVGQSAIPYKYWFDGNDHDAISGVMSSNVLSLQLNVNDLSDGIHSFSFQLQDSLGVWCESIARNFYKIGISDTATVASTEYWFDGDVASLKTLNSISGSHIIDVSMLEDGLHYATFAIKGLQNEVLDSKTALFYKLSPIEAAVASSIEYWFDGNFENIQLLNGLAGTYVVDASQLESGAHYATFVLKGRNNEVLDIKSSLFYKIGKEDIATASNIEYWFDGNADGKISISGLTGFYDIDVASLSKGLHYVTFALIDKENEVLNTQTRFFYVTNGETLISKYQYCLNFSKEPSKTVELENPVSPLSIVSLLPVESCPIRSSCFEFRIENETPVLYARNDIAFYFYDTDNRMSHFFTQYVDEQIKDTLNVDEIKTITSGVTETMPRPAENEIQWYKFEAEKGDSIAINTNYACTIDVFSPTGENIYSANGSDAISLDGTHLYETGVFYIAIHDVTATAKNSKNINVDFIKIDKYAVLSYTSHKMGNGGVNKVRFDGNGYLMLDSVLLKRNNTIIPSCGTKFFSNTKIDALFDCENAPIGKHDLVMVFPDDTLTVKNAFEIEPSNEMLFTSTVEYSNQVLIGSDANYKVSVRNLSNMTAYKIPIYVYVETPLNNTIPVIDITNVDLPSPLDNVDLSEFSESEVQELKKLAEGIGDGLCFWKLRDVNENGDSILIQSTYLFVDVLPYETLEFGVDVRDLRTSVSVYVTVPDDYHSLRLVTDPANKSVKSIQPYGVKDWYCCYKERIECIVNAAGIVSDIVNKIASKTGNLQAETISAITSCVMTAVGALSDYVGGPYCEEEPADINATEMALNTSAAYSLVMSIKDCLLEKLMEKFKDQIGGMGKWWDIVNDINNFTVQAGATIYDCYEAFAEKKPNCPPTPPKGGTTTPVQSFDPNDISGYVAESGSLYIGKQVDKVTYMIEFENDSTFATAPAHTILLADTLDTNVFDVVTVTPIKLQIGDKSHDFSSDFKGVATVDMRPEIDAIAQVSMKVDDKGVLIWVLESLDPMTMEPTTQPFNGILPVNDAEGAGMGFVTFSVNLKKGLQDGTEVANKANIIFDANEPISTPYWINETDYVDPVSVIDTLECVSDSVINIKFHGIDERSGIWKYDLYVKLGVESEWFLIEENVADSSYMYHVYDDITYGFCVVATDKAGNREVKELYPDFIYLNGEVISGVEAIKVDEINVDNGILYDLLGRRVENPSPGIYIRNGKKILIK